ncbi:MAG TPA: hypothetical protein PLF13_09045 [candidate division Zixibacteria bacterium]|nr:hypothetical protein [candidate division Zixibacteria bacterium]
MKKGLIFTLTALLLLAGIAVAQPGGGKAQGICDGSGPHGMRGRGMNGPGPGMGGPGGPGGGPMGVLGMAGDLELTDTQIEAIQGLMEGFQLQMIDHRAEVQKAEIKLRALERDNASESAVGAAIDELTRLRAQGQKMRYSHQQKVRAQLTADQLKKMDEMRMERPGFGPGGDNGQGQGQGQGQGRGPGNNGGGRGPGDGTGRGPGGMGCIYNIDDLNNNG